MRGVPIFQPKDAPMPFAHPSLSRSAIIAQLRAAGCVFAEDEAELLLAAPFSTSELAAAVERRVGGFPLEHILGWAEFCGLRIAVEPGVFVPRRRTELIVREAAVLLGAPASGPDAYDSRPAVAAPAGAGGTALAARATAVMEPFATRPERIVVDLCCGSGAVATALAAAVTGIELHAADVDPTAVRCARGNVVPAGGHVHEGDLYAALPARLRGRVDILAVNAPYVPTAALSSMPHEARDHEPRVSLDGGPDGLDVQRRVIAEAPAWLQTGGHLLIETSRRQAHQTALAMTQGGLTPRIAYSEELDATVVIGRR
jgi:release factor glutamine methyltransferase